MKNNHLLLEFPESDDILFIYYALQEAGLSCVVIRHDIDFKLIKVTPEQIPYCEFEKDKQLERIKGFIAGWKACYYREELPNDKPLTVSRVPKQNKT